MVGGQADREREREGKGGRERDLAMLHITRYRGGIGQAGEESIVKHKKGR